MRQLAGVTSLVLTVGVALVGPVAAAEARATSAEEASTINLKAGEAAFWDGPEHVSQPIPMSHELQNAVCQAGGPGCIDYGLVLQESGSRLRVALDYPFRFDAGGEGNFFALYLIDPAGEVVAHIGSPPTVYYSAELFVEDPEAGEWTVRVIPQSADDTTFRLRAKLESATKNEGRSGSAVSALLPNLRMVPPFEFTLETPGFVGGYGILGLDAAPARGVAPTRGCLVSEVATHTPAPSRCLRFSSGPENVGEGRLQLLFQPNGSGLAEGPAFQRVDMSDGSTEDRPAGQYKYHLQHGHYHHDAFGDFTLWRADPASRTVVQAGRARKQGFCMEDLKIVDWHGFANDSAESVRQNCTLDSGVLPTEESLIGLARGWGDIYFYSQEGMYVDLGDSPDGLYVVRVSANDLGGIQETTTRDNFSYALVRISGEDVEVLERGYGKGPWDPRRQVVENDLVPGTVEP